MTLHTPCRKFLATPLAELVRESWVAQVESLSSCSPDMSENSPQLPRDDLRQFDRRRPAKILDLGCLSGGRVHPRTCPQCSLYVSII